MQLDAQANNNKVIKLHCGHSIINNVSEIGEKAHQWLQEDVHYADHHSPKMR